MSEQEIRVMALDTVIRMLDAGVTDAGQDLMTWVREIAEYIRGKPEGVDNNG